LTPPFYPDITYDIKKLLQGFTTIDPNELSALSSQV